MKFAICIIITKYVILTDVNEISPTNMFNQTAKIKIKKIKRVVVYLIRDIKRLVEPTD